MLYYTNQNESFLYGIILHKDIIIQEVNTCIFIFNDVLIPHTCDFSFSKEKARNTSHKSINCQKLNY